MRGAGICLGHFLEVVIAVQIRQMRIAAVVTGHAALVERRLDVLLVGRPRGAFLRPGHQDVALVRRQHGRHRAAQRRFEARALSAARIGDDDVLVGQHQRIAARSSRVGEIDVEQGEEIAPFPGSEASPYTERAGCTAAPNNDDRVGAAALHSWSVPSVVRTGPSERGLSRARMPCPGIGRASRRDVRCRTGVTSSAKHK